jgi:hypothetical protein
MPVEIRELVLQARVIEDGPQARPGPRDAEADARLKADILARCTQLIREELSRVQAR